jgi:hypothetical protein
MQSTNMVENIFHAQLLIPIFLSRKRCVSPQKDDKNIVTLDKNLEVMHKEKRSIHHGMN